MPFIRDVSANYHSDKPSECYVMHAVIHVWYMSGLISRSVYITTADSGPRGPRYIGATLYIYFFFDSDLIIPRLVTNRTAKIRCLGLILALFNSTMVIKNDFGS